MKDRRSSWLLLGLLLVVVTSLVFVQNRGAQDSPEHRSDSDGRNGTSALYQYASALGHPAQTVRFTFSLPAPPATLFVFNPLPFTADETTTLVDWVKQGGTLVYGSGDQLDVRLALAFDLHVSNQPVPADGYPVTPAMAGVSKITDQSYTRPYVPTAAQAVLFAYSPNRAMAIEEALGQGRVIALAAPEVLCNGWLEVADNGRFAADLIAMATGPVAFDEFHHGDSGISAGDLSRQPLVLGIAWAALAIFLGLLLRSRAFGPRIALGGTSRRSAAEYSAAVGHLLRQAGGGGVALRVLVDATRRALATRVGLARDVPLSRLGEVLARRAPDVAAEFSQAEAEARKADGSEAGLLAVSRRLHALAYPMAARPGGTPAATDPPPRKETP